MLIFVKNEELLNELIDDINAEIPSSETLSITQEALKRSKVYYACMSFIDFTDKTIKIISIPDKSETTHKISELHNIAKVTLLKQIGSVEAQKEIIRKVLDLFESDYKGKFANNIKSMRYGMRKDYLLELQNNGFPVISTRIYNIGITKEKILKDISDNEKYIIKPLTGELSNSVSFLENIDNEWLRRKERIVEGWIVQPFIKDIWNGEVQLRFMGYENIFTLKKLCLNQEKNAGLPNQSERDWQKIESSPEMKELALNLKRFFEDDMGFGFIPYCRVDLIPSESGIKILEFEMVNPGMGYFSLDKEGKKIISNKLLDAIGI